MNEQELLKKFPRASRAFIQANAAVGAVAQQGGPPSEAEANKAWEFLGWVSAHAGELRLRIHHHSSQGSESESVVLYEPMAKKEGEKGNAQVRHVCITSYRTRLLDGDNACAKAAVDALRHNGIIEDDTLATAFIWPVRQIKVASQDEERTEIIVV